MLPAKYRRDISQIRDKARAECERTAVITDVEDAEGVPLEQ